MGSLPKEIFLCVGFELGYHYGCGSDIAAKSAVNTKQRRSYPAKVTRHISAKPVLPFRREAELMLQNCKENYFIDLPPFL